MLGAYALDVFEDCRAPSAHELHCAAISELAERDNRFNGISGFERDIVKNERGPAGLGGLAHGRAIWKFDGVDAGTVQDEGQEVPDAGFFIHNIAKRRAARGERRRLDGR